MSDPAGPSALELREVTYRYPDGTMALDRMSLRVAPGERVAVLGPNGAGKTTLVLHTNGILRPESGAVLVGGRPVERASLRDIRRRVGIVFQDPDDQLFMPTVGQDVAFGPANLGVRGAALEHRVDEALVAVDLHGVRDRAPHHLSFGQRRRAALATVLAMEPDLLVLDEPSANLDPAARRELAAIVHATPHTVIVVTHDLPYALELCPRAVIVDRGRVVADGPTASLLADTELLSSCRLELPRGFDVAVFAQGAAAQEAQNPDHAK